MPLRTKNLDKLARVAGTQRIALETLKRDLPYWVTLTARESRLPWRRRWYRIHAEERRAVRSLVKQLCGGSASVKKANV